MNEDLLNRLEQQMSDIGLIDKFVDWREGKITTTDMLFIIVIEQGNIIDQLIKYGI